MFVEDKARKCIDVKKEQILTLLNSTIRAHVAIPGRPTEPADAYVCTFKLPGNLYETLVFFHLTNSHEGVVYHWDEGPQPKESAKNVEKEALRFLEAMGFQIDSLHFRKKSPEEQQKLYDTLPCFKPDLSYLREPKDEGSELETLVMEEEGLEEEAIEEISVESVEEVSEAGGAEAVEVESVFAEAVAETAEAEEESVSVEAVEEEPAQEAEAVQEVDAETLEVGEETFEEAFEEAVQQEEPSLEAQEVAVEEGAVEEATPSVELEVSEGTKTAVAEEPSYEETIAEEAPVAETSLEAEAEAVAEVGDSTEAEEASVQVEEETVSAQTQESVEAVSIQPPTVSVKKISAPVKEVTTDRSLEPLARFLASM